MVAEPDLDAKSTCRIMAFRLQFRGIWASVPKVRNIMALKARVRGVGPVFYILLGSRPNLLQLPRICKGVAGRRTLGWESSLDRYWVAVKDSKTILSSSHLYIYIQIMVTLFNFLNGKPGYSQHRIHPLA